jgi:hypothetical protein
MEIKTSHLAEPLTEFFHDATSAASASSNSSLGDGLGGVSHFQNLGKGKSMPGKILQVAMVTLGLSVMGFEGIGDGHITASVTVRPVNTGQTYVPSLRLFRTPIAGRVQFTTVHRVAILPFADYSHQQSFISPLEWGGNRAIIETLTDRFLAHGIGVALQEDAEALLVADGIMRPPQGSHPTGDTNPRDLFAQRVYVANTPEYELIWGMHDQVMRDELQTVVQSQDYFKAGGLTFHASSEPILQGVTAGLPKEKIIEFGRSLDVDLIIRGRILESGFKRSKPFGAVVQIRIYAQDARSGELFWSNRGEYEVTHGKGWDYPEADYRALHDRATRQLVDALMADFFGER